MHVDLTGKHILITGASRGIGRAIAESMGRAGARIAVHCRTSHDEADAVATIGAPGSRSFAADLGDVHACVDLFDEVLSDFGHIDVLVNNAAIALEMDPDAALNRWQRDFDRTMAVNVRATELLSRRAIAHFRARDGGRLIHVASRAAFRGDTPDFMTYAASKGAVVALSRSIARGYGRDNICSFVLAPGFVRTDMAQDFIDRYGEDYVAGDIALGRLTEPSDIAPMAVLLASGLADHATGTSIDINGASYVR